jgi:probable phosphoglycerate mutase
MTVRIQGETLVYLLRHAEPSMPHDVPRFIGSRSDPPLSLEGIAHARRLARRLGHLDFGAVWGSGLVRSIHTAEIVSGRPASDIQTESRLQEIDLGLWDGLSASQIQERFPREWTERESDLLGLPFPGGESFRQLQNRTVPAFMKLAAKALEDATRTVLVAGHKSVNRVLLCHFLGLPLEEMFSIQQEYCSLNVLRATLGTGGQITVTVMEVAA